MMSKFGFLCLMCCFMCLRLSAQQIEPHIQIIEANGEAVDRILTADSAFVGSAPVVAKFVANPSGNEGRTSLYEWRIVRKDSSTPSVVRYDEDVDFTFTESGTFEVTLYATFIDNATNDTIVDDTQRPITITVSESSLFVPNAFSPNGDGINDVFKIKAKSIVEFHAYIFNRWGQQLYEWGIDQINDGGWDGTSHGKPVKDGVYFIVVKAKGSDGIKYNIRHDINILRGYESTSAVSNQ